MALPPQAIEQLSREPARTPGWSGRLLMFSSTLFFLALFAYGGLAFGYQKYLQGQADRLEREVQATNQQISSADQEDLLIFYSQLGNLEKILANHVFASNIFRFLEQNTHPNVYFTRLEVNTENQKAILQGVAKAVRDVTEQVRIFEQQPHVRLAGFNNVSFISPGTSLPQGGWQFDAELQFQPAFFTEASFGTTLAAPENESATTTPASAQ